MEAWKQSVSSMASQPEVVDFGAKLFEQTIVTGWLVPSYQFKKKDKYALEVTVGDEGPVEGGWGDTFSEAEQQAALLWLAQYLWNYKLGPSNNQDKVGVFVANIIGCSFQSKGMEVEENEGDIGARLRPIFCSLGEITRADGSVMLCQVAI